ncbi:MAG TPA: glycosyltransferase, partial [Chloroflexota bacterium]
MRILFLTPQLPHPPRQGTQIRNYHLLKAAATAHEVDLLSFARTGERVDESSPLRDICAQVQTVPVPLRSTSERLRHLLTSRDPDMAHRLRSEGFAATLESTLARGRYDLVQIEGIELARYIPIIKRAAQGSAVVFDDHNAEYLLQGRAAAVDGRRPRGWPKAVYSTVQWQKLRFHEAWACREADAVLAVSQEDANALRRLGGAAPVSVIPNGVDTEENCPTDGWTREPATVLFTGTMDYRPNVDAVRWFASDVLPLVAARRPEIRFEIVGRSPSPAVIKLAANPSVVVTGAVADVAPYFARATLFVVPMRMGGGVRLKLLEALACGVPVVSTAMGAEGTGLRAGEHFLEANRPGAFARAVVDLIDDDVLRNRICVAGREAVVRLFDWSRIAPRLLETY